MPTRPLGGTMRNEMGLLVPIGTGVAVPDDRIPLSKLAPSSAAARLMGRRSASAGDWEEITLGTNLSMSGTTLNATGGGGGLSDGDMGDITVSGSGTVLTIDNDVVTYAKMQNVSATDKVLGRSSSGAGDIEEIPCTAAARSVLDDATVADIVDTIGGAASTGTGGLVRAGSPALTGTPTAPTASANDNSTKIATTAYADAAVAAAVAGLLDFKGSTDCSANPNYPAASKGDSYVVSVAGKIGGASGKSVDVGDLYVASADNAGGTEASVGTSWFVLEHNLAGALLAANNLSDVANAGTARTNLGVGTGDSPQFTAINVGHASDTTLARSAAGTLTVEGNELYRAGGTDVPVADGGTGRSSHTAYAVLCGGTTTTAAQQSIASVGTSGQVLTSNGAGALPTFQDAAGGGETLFNLTDPVNGDFSWVNQGGSSVNVETGGGITFIGAAGGTGSVWEARMRVKTAPSTPYTVMALVIPKWEDVAYTQVGLVFRASGSGLFNVWGPVSNNNFWGLYGYSNVTTLDRVIVNAGARNQWLNYAPYYWIYVTDDGTNRKYGYSMDGINKEEVYSEGRTTDFTANQVGVAIGDYTGTTATTILLRSWAQS